MDRNEQTEAVFKSSRTEVDPVSGNEVPPGATAEEVRDDIPAMLSENEYVVPADVVRYFGVRFFEDLREKAKEDMVELEEGGRIGGEPIEDDGEDLPFDISELSVVDEPDEEAEVGFADGGVVIDPSVANMEAPDFLGGTSAFGGSGDEYKTFKNAAGLIMNVRFVNGKPMSYIPPGYEEQGTATEEAAAAVTTSAPAPTVQSTYTGGGDGPANEVNTPVGRAASSANSSEAAAPEAPSYGIAGGKLGSAAVGTGLGAAFGPTGAVTGAQVGIQAGKFNEARNDLAQAVMANDTAAIEAAKEAVTTSYNKMGLGAKAVTFNEGKTAKDAIANVMSDVQNFLGISAQGASGTTGGEGAQSNVGNWGGDRDNDGIPNALDFNDGVGWADRGATANASNTASISSPSVSTPSAVSRGAVNAAVNEAMGYSSVNPNTGQVSKDPNASFNATGQVAGTGWSGRSSDRDAPSTDTEGSGGDGGDKVICTALYHKGLLSHEIYTLDVLYGARVAAYDPALRSGYHKWAIPVAEYIKGDSIGSRIALKAITPFARAWAKQMAHELKPEKYKANLLGKLIMAIGHPICRRLGKQQEEVYGT